MINKNTKIKIAVVNILLLLAIISWWAVFAQNGSNFLSVSFFDVGQGSAIFIELGNKQILIDGGPSDTILHKLGQTMPFYDKEIDVLVLSHGDADHLAGLYEVLKNYKVKNILQSCVQDESALFKQWQELINRQKITNICVRAGDSVSLGRAKLTVLYPFISLSRKQVKDSNEASVVVRLDFGQNSFLITGDADKKVERGLVFSGANIDVDFLAVGHHGSKTSSSQEFLQKVNPIASIIQAGLNNRYGHPHQEVTDLLNSFGIEILRTDEGGDINFKCTPQKCFLIGS